MLVNGHGGNVEPVTRAVDTLTAEGRRVLSWWPTLAGGDAHAGRTETSLMLAIRPSAVRSDLAVPGDVRSITTLAGALRAGGVAAVSPNGVLGDPTGASAREGERLLQVLVDDLTRAVASWAG